MAQRRKQSLSVTSRRRFLRGALGACVLPSLKAHGVLAAATRPADDAMQCDLPVRAVTHGPKSHFFGYYDKCPWDGSVRYLLAMQVGFYNRDPEPGEALTLGTIDLQRGDRFEPFDTTLAWSWQQGTMLQWMGTSRRVIYNTLDGDRYAAVIRDLDTGRTRTLPHPICAISGDGRQAVTLDYERVNRLRPGYGYIALPESNPEDPAPADRGIYWMDLATGENKLILSLEWAAGHRPDGRFQGGEHWFNHLQFNPSGTRFVFLHRWRKPDSKGWQTRLYTAAPDGSDVRLLSDAGMVSHFDWRDDRTILAWTRTPDRGTHFYLIDDRTGAHTVVGEGVLPRDGHCTYSPDRKWILTDTYPDRAHMQTLILYRVADGMRFDVGRFYQPPALHHKPYRCDLHPRWNRDGTLICIDSTHELSRQMYLIDVSEIVKSQGESYG